MADDNEGPAYRKTSPAEDAGAETYSRYHFQAEVAARDCMVLLSQGRFAGIICEWHEDHILLAPDASPELVSVKHREPSQSPWTLRELFRKGGLSHLFLRWIALDKSCVCRMTTNASVQPGAHRARGFVDMVHARRRDSVARAAEMAAPLLPAAESPADVAAFLNSLQIECGIPGRSHLAAHNLQAVARPLADSLGIDSRLCDSFYAALVDALSRCMRGHAGEPVPLSFLAHPERLTLAVAREHKIKLRTLLLGELQAIILNAVSPPEPLLGVGDADAPEPSAKTRLHEQLSAAGFGPTAIRFAKKARAEWFALEAKYRNDLPGAANELRDLRLRVLAIAAAAEQCTKQTTSTHSPALTMLDQLRVQLHPDRLGRRPPFPLDPIHLFGLLYQLTDDGEVVWPATSQQED